MFSLANERPKCQRDTRAPLSSRTLQDVSEQGPGGRPAAAQVNPRPVIAVGIGLFFAGFVVLLPFWSWLGEHHHRAWLWTCLAGWLLGLVGWVLMGRHRRAGRTR